MREEQALGWAELECALAYKKCSPENLNQMIQIFFSHGFKVHEKYKFGAFTLEGDDLILAEDASYNDFIQEITNVKCNVAVVNLWGSLHDLQAKISLCFFPKYRVITISSRENFIWGHGNNLKLSNINRVIAFFCSL